MKKTYIIPASEVHTLGCGDTLCESIFVGSGDHDYSRGDGTDLTKQQGDWSDIWSSSAADAGVNP